MKPSIRTPVILCALIMSLLFGALVTSSAQVPIVSAPSVQRTEKHTSPAAAPSVTVKAVEETPIGKYAPIVHATVARVAFAINIVRELDVHTDGVDHVPLS